MSIVLRLEDVSCERICKAVDILFKKEKPDPNKYYLVIGLSEKIDGGDDHIPKIELKEIIQE
jgi:hypothetical protein